ncbi:4-alpha-glucanotransferase [Desulfitobacterium dichloroeliminans LMG P-21439]|uniref:4-alpha-glucanotransferase n=1 Tax=Desulfitobacterium dichloroeliminans (strain LMG P-21439 / DCA1) TaxID=871963 RepID=L0F8X0_DESDL|nr:4-alpha-glucanotransferase [Desulfitobacterium dichloroeliminans LMG P-21439]
MEVQAYHHSHSEFFRNPFGAAPRGSRIQLRIHLKGTEWIEECLLRLWEGGKEVLLPMVPSVETPSSFPEEGVTFQVDYRVPDEPGLVWYFFMFKVREEVYYYGNNENQLGGEGQIYDQEPPGYQITVYNPMCMPDWYTRGIMYQIYVDRFFDGIEGGKLNNLPPKALLHGDWHDTPFYIKNEKGEVLRWDFFGGNLLGVLKRLPYLKELGISIIYLNPIFAASSNHKYDTGDYLTIDPMYGDISIFDSLVKEARRLGISILLDGVFSHTGDDSIYFNRYGNYPSLGAYQSPDSPYYSWYKWQEEGVYSCWWGVKTLPEVNELDASYRNYIIHSPQGVLQTWMNRGIKGWRLDVADELPDEFIKEFRQVMKALDPEAVLIGEVWEDPTNKSSYGKLRQYFWGSELDGTMNYPFREIFLQFLLGDQNAYQLHQRIMNLYENYPRENFFGQMNLIGSHDRARILTLLGEAPAPEDLTVYEQEDYRLPPHHRWLATQRLKLFTLIQMSFPGVPCVYYGDEAGLEGYPDPYNRGTYPWGREDQEILHWVKRVLRYRQEYDVLQQGDFVSWPLEGDVYSFKRRGEKEEIITLVNRSSQWPRVIKIELEKDIQQVIDLFEGVVIYAKADLDIQTEERIEIEITLPPLTGKSLYCQKNFRDPFFKKEIMTRSCGVLLSISSLPSAWGIGDFGNEAYDFVNFLAEGGQRIWQVLPLNPLDQGDSPYQSESAFAGNPLYISIDSLIQSELLKEEEARREYEDSVEQYLEADEGDGFTRVKAYKDNLLRLAYRRFKHVMSQGESDDKEYLNPSNFEAFIQTNQVWLQDYAYFKCLKLKHQGLAWNKWEEKFCLRDSEAIEVLTKEMAEEINVTYFIQYTFAYQWEKLKRYANTKGLTIMGDMPIFVGYDSSDVWANQEFFNLDEENIPRGTAGVPPDYFSPTGQNWGNPLYDWDTLAKMDYVWWKERLRQGLQRFDVLRLDHFRGFEAYWEIPRGANSAEQGRWLKGPGKRFFECLSREFGSLPLIAEDLGTITSEVKVLKGIFGFPGMKVMQFSPMGEEVTVQKCSQGHNDHKCIYYSGTHDNDTLLGWFLSQGYNTAQALKSVEVSIEELYKSQGTWVILPLQDILKLDSRARMNKPGTIAGNWNWRVEKMSLTQDVSAKLRSLAIRYNRLAGEPITETGVGSY